MPGNYFIDLFTYLRMYNFFISVSGGILGFFKYNLDLTTYLCTVPHMTAVNDI